MTKASNGNEQKHGKNIKQKSENIEQRGLESLGLGINLQDYK